MTADPVCSVSGDMVPNTGDRYKWEHMAKVMRREMKRSMISFVL